MEVIQFVQMNSDTGDSGKINMEVARNSGQFEMGPSFGLCHKWCFVCWAVEKVCVSQTFLVNILS